MKIYGIAREIWDGNKYSCEYDTDIMLYVSEEKRDKDYDMLMASVLISDIQYIKFETELNEEERSEQ